MYSHIELVDMDWNEVFNIECFAIDSINTQSGLPKKKLVPPGDWEDGDDSDMDGRRSGWYRNDEM